MLAVSKITPVSASVGHVLIEHTVQDEWYFASPKQAHAKLLEIQKHFITEDPLELGLQRGDVVLWIKHYQLSPADRTRGMTGRFASIAVVRGEDGFWTLKATPLNIPLFRHPQRSKRSKYPSWSNPLLKMFQAGHVFATQEEIQDAFMALHEGYPSASTPGLSKMQLNVMTRDDKGEPLKQKLVFLIQPASDGKAGFVVQLKDTTMNRGQKNKSVKAKKTPLPTQAKTETEEPANKGYFASMVELKKKQKRV